jgi:type I restriction enzyme S subunit
MKTDLLRKYLLQLAVQGKLVPQQTSEGTAQDLVDNIREEKAVLVSEKKLKKDPKESYIYRDEEGHFMERIGKQEPVCIDNDLPFAVPEGWTWARLGEIGEWSAGSTPDRGYLPFYKGGTIPWLKTGELNNGVVTDTEEKITELALQNCPLKLNKVGDVLIAMYGATIGQLAIAGIPLTTNQACCACSLYKEINNWYLFYFLMANKSEFIELGAGGAQPNISRQILVDFLLPLPPLAEQARIVSKVEELLEELEEMDASRADMKKRCDLTRKMILQQAIKGALVPQQTSEGTAQDLVDNIREEKAVLVSEKKLKKDPKESYIYRDEEGHFMERIGKQEPVCIDNDLPFAVPEGWTWARLGEITKCTKK